MKMHSSIVLILICIAGIEQGYAQANTQNNVVRGCAVVPELSGGRLGDNLVACSHALYFALKNHCSMYIPSFKYLDQLVLGDLPIYTPMTPKYFKKRETVLGKNVSITEPHQNTLFILPYFPEAPIELTQQRLTFFSVDWDDAEFRQELVRLIAPKSPLTLVNIPSNKISVAVHVRKGGSHSNETELSKDPVKLSQGNLIYKIPLDEYYINQINTIASLYPDIPLYVFLFTDDQNPEALMKHYKERIHNERIEFDCRKGQHDYFYNVLEDLFSMMHFDILIRSESNFSIMAEKLGEHSIIISPGNFIQNTYVHEGNLQVKRPLRSLDM